MRNRLSVLLLSAMLLLAAAPAHAQAVLYGANEIGNQTYLARIDPATGVTERIGNGIGFDNIRSMDADPVSGVMYATAARVVDVGSVEFILLTIDLDSGQGTEVMSLGTFNGPIPSRIAVRPSDGSIFFGWQSSGFAQVFPPDDVDGVPSRPIFPVQAFDFDSQDRLWGTFIEGNIFCIEPGIDGSCNQQDVFIENGRRVSSMSFEPGTDTLYVIGDGGSSGRNSSHLYILNRDTGNLTLVVANLMWTALAWHTPVDLNTPIGNPTVTIGPVSLTFSNVERAGTTTLAMGTTGPPPPAGFQLGNPPTYYDLTTTATYDEVTICINYTGVSWMGSESSLVLAHFEEDAGGWVNRTTAIDTVNNIICAQVDSLSPFAIFEPEGFVDATPPMLVVPAGIVVSATGPGGATVSFEATATDDSGVASVQCLPASGSVFPIGTTSVSCTAADGSGNIDTDGFTVTVQGAAEQIVDMLGRLRRVPLNPTIKARLIEALTEALADRRNVARVCRALRLFAVIVQLQAGRTIPADLAAQLIADGIRIRAVLGCM
jgi:HYR domain